MYSGCAGDLLLGGFNWTPNKSQNGKVLQRSYNGLPEHKYIQFTFKFWAIDSWDKELDSSLPYDSFNVQFDSLPVFVGFGMWSGDQSNSLCGNSSYKDFPDGRVYGWIEHSSTSLLLAFISKMSSRSADESFGIREIELLFTNTLPTGSSYCAYTRGLPIYHQLPCTCPTGQYPGSSGCTNCHEDCESCYGFGSDKCYACASGRYFDGKRCAGCDDSSCSKCSGPGVEECIECDVGFVLWNGKCIPDTRCVSPMTLDTCTGGCVSPCLNQNINLWEEYCFPPCSTGYISNLEATCIRCESLVVQYLKATDVGHQYSLKLYPGSCDFDIKTVRRYLTITEEIEGSVGPFTFDVTKTGASQYFVNLVLAESVLEASSLDVQLSYLKGTMPVPKKFVPNPTLQEIAKMIPTAKSVLTGSMSGSLVASLLLGASASLWSIISFQQFVGYFIYINIEFPYQTELFLMLLQSSLWDMLPNPLSRVMSSLSKNILKEDAGAVTIYDPPAKFVKYEMNSFFVENGGTIIAVNVALPALLGLVIIIRKVKYLKENYVLEKVERFLRWNFIVRSFLENGIPLSLAIFLQLRIMMFDDLYLSLCGAFAIFSFLLTLGSILALWIILKNRTNQQLKKSNIEKIYGTLYEGIVLAGGSTKYYNLIILLRGILGVCLVSFFEAVPLFQIAPLILFNFSLVYYLFKQVPFEDKKLTKIVRIKEIFILCAELCIFCLLFGGNSQFYYDFIGYLALGFLSTALAIEVIYMFALQIIELRNLPKNLKKTWKDIQGFWNKCLKSKKPSIQAKHRLEATVIKIRSQKISGDSSLNISLENQTMMKF